MNFKSNLNFVISELRLIGLYGIKMYLIEKFMKITITMIMNDYSSLSNFLEKLEKKSLQEKILANIIVTIFLPAIILVFTPKYLQVLAGPTFNQKS